MIYSYKELRQKIEFYYDGKIGLEELGAFCANAYYNIIKGDYIFINNLLIYPLLKTLYRLNIEPNEQEDIFPCGTDEIATVYDILSGEKDVSFYVEVGINQTILIKYAPERKEIQSQYESLRVILNDYIQCHTLSYEASLILRQYSATDTRQNTTIVNCVDNYIAALFRSITVDDLVLNLSNPLGLYCTKRINLDDIIKRIIHCLEWCGGLSDINMCVSYVNGIPSVNILITDLSEI